MSMQLDAVADHQRPAPAVAWPWRRDRLFFSGMAAAAAIVVFAGFARTYYLKSAFGTPALPPLLHTHGLIFTSWILLFIVQTRLIAGRRTPLHRRLGVLGGVLAVAMVIVGSMAAIASARRGFTPPGGPPPLVFLVIPLGDLFVFSVLAGTGLYFRRQSPTHKRLMLLATVGLLTAAIARLPGVLGSGPLVYFALTDVFVLACFAYDRIASSRIHPAFKWGGLFLIAMQPLRLAIAGTAPWLAFAEWVTR